jgi:hypothetical protein
MRAPERVYLIGDGTFVLTRAMDLSVSNAVSIPDCDAEASPYASPAQIGTRYPLNKPSQSTARVCRDRDPAAAVNQIS